MQKSGLELLVLRPKWKVSITIFGISVAELVYNLSKALQNETISAAEGQRLAAMTVTTLTKMRDAEQFDLFWQLILKKSSALDVSEPRLPRKRKVP